MASGATGWRTAIQRARDRRWVRWSTDLLTVLVVVTAVGAFQARHHLRDVAVPPFTLSALDGSSLSSAALTGKPTLLAFWAPWCTVCGAESGNLSLLQQLVGDRARVISIAASFQETAQVQRYVTAHGVDYPVLLGG